MARSEPIAVVGVSCRLPGGADDLASATRLFRSGRDAVRAVPADRFALPATTSSGRPVPTDAGLLDRVDTFDAGLFGISPREARGMDPQQRMLLEAAWAALEDAARAPDALAGTRTGVYVGMGLVDWARRTFGSDAPDRLDAWAGTGVFDSVAAGRIAYVLGLRGPALAVHTACSSSLVAVHLAVRALRAGECDLALAGGVNLLLAPEPTVYFAELQALSPTGRCRTFDAAADGYVRGEGCGLLALERLTDARAAGRRVHAVLLGSAVNQDGRTTGLTAPSGKAQQEVVRAALADAGVAPGDVGYVEAHGTGTPLGDPIEVAALAAVLGHGDRPLRVGSGKTQIGHLEAAAGVAGLVRAIGAVRGGIVPPHLHLERPNPRLRLDGTRIRIPTAAEPWDDLVRIAGVSAFGLSGTNAHVVLGPPPDEPPAERTDGTALVAVSGRTVEAVRARIEAVRAAPGPLPAVARAAAEGRAALPARAAKVARTAADLGGDWEIREGKRPPLVAWAFTGQGAQLPGMGKALYASSAVYREAADRVEAAFRAHTGRSLLDVVHGPDDGRVHRTGWTQPALFLVEWGLSEVLRAWGLAPDAVLGHSVGEIVAAAVAGVVGLDDAVRLVAERGALLEALPEGGAMVALRTGEDAVREALAGLSGVAVAAVNAPDEVVVSGDALAVDAAVARLPGVKATRLQVSHAFHSPRVEPAAHALGQVVRGMALRPPATPLYGCLHGRLAGEEVATADYWRTHIVAPVRFAAGVQAAHADGHALFVEVGPRRTLAAAGARTAPDAEWLGTLDPQRDDLEALLELAGALFVRGFRPDWSAVHRGAERAELPPYPFARDRYWIDPVSPRNAAAGVPAWALVREAAPAGRVPGGTWRVEGDGLLADALRAALPPGDGAVVWIPPPGALHERLAEMATRARHGRLAVVTDDEALAEAAAGLGATLRLDAAWGGVVRVLPDAPPEAVVAALAAGEDAVAGSVAEVTRIVRDERALPAPAFDDRPVWVTGGSGALARAVVGRLAARGVRVLAISRTGSAPEGAEGVAADVADEDALRGLLARGAPQAVLHLAGAAPSPSLDDAGFALALRAKRLGAEVLTRVLPADVRLVLVGSIAGIWGGAGLGAYGAANRALHALARRRAGTVALALGPLALGGMVPAASLQAFARQGVRALPDAVALDAIEQALSPSCPAERIVADVDWTLLAPLLEARRPFPLLARVRPPPPPSPAPSRLDLPDLVQAEVAAVLGASSVDPAAPLFDLGLDSVMAVELVQRLRARTGVHLPATAAFDHPTVRQLTDALRAALGAPVPAPAVVIGGTDEPVAVVGFSCRFPGAPDPEAYWALLRDGVDAVGPVPADRWDPAAWPDAPRHGGFLDDVTAFEPDFFGLSPREAEGLDPQQRLLLEVAWEALERAGTAPDRLEGSAGAVFVGVGRSEYWDRLRRPELDGYPWSGTGNESSFAAGRLAHLLGLRGPALSVNTACSSSLVAVHLACRAIRDGEADLALAGGVNVWLSPESGTYLARLGALSPTGRCRTFDAAADGYVRGEGCGVLVLKPLAKARSDGDRVWALIRGSAVGHDGRSGGLTVPSGPAQQAVLRRALKVAGVAPGDVTLLEAHGTGTPLGDPIELGAVRAVYGERSRELLVGAVKTQVGHLETAAGVAGLVKLVLALAHRAVPGSLHLQRLNPAIPVDFPVRFPTVTEPWPDAPRIAAVSSFGISGTDAHVVLEAVDPPERPAARGDALLVVSGHTPGALAAARAAVGDALARHAPADVASTLAHGRAARRLRVAAADAVALRAAVAVEVDRPARVGFLFTGQGAQVLAMAAPLAAADPAFRADLEALAGPELLPVLLGEDPRVDDTRFTQPALVVLGLALARRWAALGVVPDAVLGHSVGEITAAAVAGILSEEDAVALATERGRLVGELPRDGRMVAVRAPEEAVRPLLDADVDVAGVNGPDETVLSGGAEAVERVVARLGLEAKELRTSHAFHSPRMDPVVGPLARVAVRFAHRTPERALVSNLDGAVARALGPDHWPRHLRAPVRFADGLATLAARCDVWLEIGPRPVLSALAARVRPDRPCFPTLRPPVDPLAVRRETAGALWTHGAAVDLGALVPRRPPIPLATTAWQRVRCWVDAPEERPRAAAAPRWTVAWEPARGGRPVEAHVVRPADATEALEALRAATGPLALVTVRGTLDDPGQAAVWGLAASAALERPELALVLVDLDRADADPAPALATGERRAAVRDGQALVPRLVPAVEGDALPVHGAWLVTGGAGALGRPVVGWLLAQGATKVWVCGRRDPGPLPEGAAFVRADVASEAEVTALLGATGPLDGVVHLAGVAHGGLLRTLSAADLAAVAAPKLDGARWLDRHAGDVPMVLFSSAIGWLGLPGQGAYGAASQALVAFAEDRLRRGRRTHAVAWGPWSIGMAEGADWAAEGVRPLDPATGVASLAAALRAPSGAVVLAADWDRHAARYGERPAWLPGSPAAAAAPPLVERLRSTRAAARPAVVRDAVTALVGRVLGRPPDDPIPARRGLFDAGFDSLMAVDLSRRLARETGLAVPATVAFDHPDVEALTAFVLGRLGESAAPAVVAPTRADEPVAVVGMACRFPGAADPDALWELLLAGRVPIREVPRDRWDPDAWADRIYARDGAFLDGIDQFDPDFFGISPREAASLDPQQRLLLEVAWEALERGRRTRGLRGSRTGVFVGIAERNYLQRFRRPGAPMYPDAWAGTGTEPAFAAGRLAFALGVHGPAMALDTTCSSSLVAAHLACASLRAGECDQALAGGVALMLFPDDTAYLCALGALSRTGRCHTFDARADGYVRGEGCGMVVLRRLSDAERDGDEVLAVIRGSAVNHDGPSAGLTVPNGAAQEAVLRAALAAAGARPDEVGYLEAHGTGTPLGDPIEVRAALAVYGPRLCLGAVKANIGHTELAAGVASLIKAVQVLRHGTIPPHPDLRTVNPELALDGAVIPTSAVPWPAGTRLTAVSAFGLSGTNAHLLLEAGPAAPERGTEPDRPVHLLALSARSEAALEAYARALAGCGPLPDVAAAVHARVPMDVRAAVVAADEHEAARHLAEVHPRRAARPPRVAFLFSGQGAQFGGMGLALAQHSSVFRAALDRCAAVLDPLLGRPLHALLAHDDLLRATEVTQPALLAVQWATAETLRAWGVEPVALAGHSLGELTAVTVAGGWAVEDALTLAAARGRLMAERARPGAMAAVSAANLRLAPGAEIAAFNAPDEVAIAGPEEAVEATLAMLPPDVRRRRLDVSRPFHSACVEPMLDAWEAAVRERPPGALALPVASLLSARVEDAGFRDPAFWRRHAREPVRCADGLVALADLGVDVLVDVGAHPVLLGLAGRVLGDRPIRRIATARRDAEAWRALAEGLGGLFEAGVDLDWTAWDADFPRRRVTVPTTPFDRRRFWLEEPVPTGEALTYAVRWEASPPGAAPGEPWEPDRAAPLADRLLALVARLDEGDPVVLVTRRADTDPDAAALWGAARCLQLERPGRLAVVDLSAEHDLAVALASAEDQVRVRGGAALVPRLERVGLPPRVPVVSGTWVVTGGLGGVGLKIAAWLRERGAAKLVLVGRNASEGEAVHALRRAGAEVVLARADVADRDAMAALLAAHPPDGVVHAAGVTLPQASTALDRATAEVTLRGKVEGARVLDELLAGRALQAFVLTGSIAATWGSRDLTSYAAANAFLDGLASARRARGETALAVAFGPWGGGGMVDAARAAELARAGLGLLDPEAALAALGAAMASDRAHVVVAKVDWTKLAPALEAHGPRPMLAAFRPAAAPPPVLVGVTFGERLARLPQDERRATLLAHLERRVREVTRLDPGRAVDAGRAIADLGFDSLMATELKSALVEDGLDVPLGRLLGGPPLDELAHMLLPRVAPAPRPAERAPEEGGDGFLLWTHLAAVVVGIALAAGVGFLLFR